jgi:hypothetical protein
MVTSPAVPPPIEERPLTMHPELAPLAVVPVAPPVVADPEVALAPPDAAAEELPAYTNAVINGNTINRKFISGFYA